MAASREGRLSHQHRTNVSRKTRSRLRSRHARHQGGRSRLRRPAVTAMRRKRAAGRRRLAGRAPRCGRHFPRAGLCPGRSRSGPARGCRRSGRSRGRRGCRRSSIGCRRSCPGIGGRGAGRGRLGRHHHRHRRDASAALGSAQADGQHAGFRAGAAICRRQRHLHAQQRGRHRRSQSHHSGRFGIRQAAWAMAGLVESGRPIAGRRRWKAAWSRPRCSA